MVEHYLRKMNENGMEPDERIVVGFKLYTEAVRKAEREDAEREVFIEKAVTHIQNFINHVRTYIGKYSCLESYGEYNQ